MNHPLPITRFNSAQDNQPKPDTLTWPELQELLTKHTTQTQKGGEAFSPVRYAPGAKRGNENVLSVSCFVVDIDDGTSPALLRPLWEGLAWCLYSSFSSTTQKPKYRVVFPLAAPVLVGEWRRVWQKLVYHLTEGHADPAAKDPARLYFLPSCPPEALGEAFTDAGEGAFLDPDSFDDPPAFERVADLVTRGPAIGASASFKAHGSASGVGAGKPGQDFNEKATHAELLALLQKHGWQEHSRKGNAIYVTRPGKDTREGVSGVIGWPGDLSPVFYCFTSSFAGLEDRAYAPFGLLGTLEHGGRFDEAARELGKAGYGEQESKAQRTQEKARPLTERQEEAKAEARPVRLGDFNKTDAGNAERLIARHGQDLRFVPGLGWRVWDGKRWAADETTVVRYARDTVRALYLEAAELLREAHQEPDKEIRKQLATSAEQLATFALRSESTRALAAMVEQSKSFAEIAAEAHQFNLKPWQVPFQNGVWDRGQWRAHHRQDFTEHLLPVCYDKDADRSEWLALLDRMTGSDAQFARTLQDVAGYCLSGASTLRLLPWAYGPKGTGKSTFAELLQTTLGASGKPLDSTLLSGDRESERLGAAVRSMRAVFLPESGRKRLDAELLKMLTGSDRIPCRLLYSNLTFSVMPSWAVFAVANDPPAMNAHDEALRDRVIALPFVHRLDKGEELTFRDGKRLEEVRRNQGSALVAGFVAWVVEGLERVHQAQDIYRAPLVTEHTRKFWDETDPLTPFWEGLDKAEIERGMAANALHRLYVSWCEQEGQKRPLQGRAFAAACRAAGLEQKRGEKGIAWFKPAPSLPLQSVENPVGMYEKTPVFEKSSKREVLGDFTKNTPESYIPTGIGGIAEAEEEVF